MLDFTELSKDGQDLELLIRELLVMKGQRAYWSGKGSDGGKDLICHESINSIFVPETKIWLLQCKHNAHSGKSVSLNDLDDIVDSCNHHGAKGYVLVCSTHPSSKVVERLEGITANPHNNIVATYWDAVMIEQLLSTPRFWTLAQRFFPISANAYEWKLYGTDKPNHWIANYRGYYFHLANRVSSDVEMHLESISERVNEIGRVPMPEGHFIRIRAVYYNDVTGSYVWYLDYLWPTGSKVRVGIDSIKDFLGDGLVLSDGQDYHFDILEDDYWEHSDHYDKDHYDYYVPYIGTFMIGGERPSRKFR
jgi:hypothetical protein